MQASRGEIFAIGWKVFVGKKGNSVGKSRKFTTHLVRSEEVWVGGGCAGHRWQTGSDDAVGAAVSGLSCK